MNLSDLFIQHYSILKEVFIARYCDIINCGKPGRRIALLTCTTILISCYFCALIPNYPTSWSKFNHTKILCTTAGFHFQIIFCYLGIYQHIVNDHHSRVVLCGSMIIPFRSSISHCNHHRQTTILNHTIRIYIIFINVCVCVYNIVSGR